MGEKSALTVIQRLNMVIFRRYPRRQRRALTQRQILRYRKRLHADRAYFTLQGLGSGLAYIQAELARCAEDTRRATERIEDMRSRLEQLNVLSFYLNEELETRRKDRHRN